MKAKYISLFETAADMVYFADKDGYFTFVNKYSTELLGFDTNEIIGKHFTSLIRKDYQRRIALYYRNLALQLTNHITQEFPVILKNGSEKWVSQNVTIERDKEGNILSFSAIVRDITNIKKESKEKELQYSILTKLSLTSSSSYNSIRNAYKHVCEQVTLGLNIDRVSIWTLNENELFCENLFENTNNKHSSGAKLCKSDYPKYFNEISQGLLISARNAFTHQATQEFISEYLVRWNIKSLLDIPIRINGILIGILCCESTLNEKEWTLQDHSFAMGVSDIISQLIETEKRLQIENSKLTIENNFKLITETISDTFWLYNLVEQKFDFISNNCSEMFNVKPDFFYEGNSYTDTFIFNDDKPSVASARAFIEEGIDYDIKYRVNVMGAIKWLSEKSFAIKDENGVVIKTSGIFTDITQKHLTELELHDKTKKLDNTISQITFNAAVKEKLIKANSIEDITENALKYIKESIPNCIRISCLHFDENSNTFSGYRITKNITDYVTLKVNDLKSIESFKKGETFIENDLQGSSFISESDKEHMVGVVKSYIAMPLNYNKTFLGALFLSFDTAFNLTDNQIKNLEDSASYIAIIKSQILLKEKLTLKNNDVLDSLKYAQSLQNAILPKLDKLSSFFKDVFLYYKPKDIVSGDFYYYKEVNNLTYLAIADCTGHGVPGAFLTVLGINTLENIILTNNNATPAEILTKLDERVYQALNENENENTLVRDGMEIALCVYDKKHKVMSFSGAGLGLLYYRNDEEFYIKGQRKSIGDYRNVDFKFTNYEFPISGDECFFMATDGFQDQLGGKNYKRFSKKKLMEVLKNLGTISGGDKKEVVLKTEFENFIGINPQTDDVTVFGFCINEIKPFVDFTLAKEKHLNWKNVIADYLDGKSTLTQEQAVSHFHCDLGKCFYSEGKFKYGHVEAMQKFEVAHEQLHNTIKDIVKYKSGGDLEMADLLYYKLIKKSDEIIDLLSIAEKIIND